MKHNPIAMISSVSSVMNLRIILNNVGIMYIPKMNHITKKNTSFSMLINSSAPLKLLPTDRVDSITIRMTATRSSTTNAPITSAVNFSFFSFKSSKALTMMLVDEMDSIQPRKMQFIFCQPKSFPTKKPAENIITNSVRTMIAPCPPTFFSFLNENSSPMANNRNTIPISLHVDTLAVSLMTGKYVKYGPIKKPATIYPRTKGCFNHLKIIVVTPAVIRISARSENNAGNPDISILFPQK